MTDAISREEYEEEVDEYAAWLTEEAIEAGKGENYEGPHSAAHEVVGDILHGHNWFARDYHGESLYGSIIEHSDADPGRFSGWKRLSEAETPREMIKRTAQLVFQTDVLNEATDRLEDE